MSAPSPRLVLPESVTITPVMQVPADLRERFAHTPGDFCVTLPRSRTSTCVVDGQTAELLRLFRSPTSIVDAVLSFSRSTRTDPARLLDEAFPVLAALAADGLLVQEGSAAACAVTPALDPGERIRCGEDVEIVRCVRLLDDTEVYLGHHLSAAACVAVKRLGRSAGHGALAAIRHEEQVLRILAGRAGPALVWSGEHDGVPTLVTRWVPGVDLSVAAADARRQGGTTEELHALGLAVLDSYTRLHACGVLHGDVHPRNVLVTPSGTVTIVDFGAACIPHAQGAPVRGGIDLYQAPEMARCRLDDDHLPAPTTASEMYSLGALLYWLMTGGPTHLFSLNGPQMLRQVMEDLPLRFDHYGVTGHAVETCLARALAKDPAQRFGSVLEFAEHFQDAAATDRRTGPRPLVRPNDPEEPTALLEATLRALAPGGDLQRRGLPAPTASVAHGAAGLAYALLRTAQALDREDVLASADLWSTGAVAAAAGKDGLQDDARGIGPALFGEGSLFHHAGGVHLVHALVAHARGDTATCRRQVEAFSARARPDAALDVAFGRAGLLLGHAALVETVGAAAAGLVDAGEALSRGIWSELAGEPPIADGGRLTTLGMSHGWAGALTALLRWSAATSTAPPDGLGQRLGELAALGSPVGRGLVWPRKLGTRDEDPLLTASWCNGSAGYVALWTLAARFLPGGEFEELARAAAWHAYEGAGPAPGGLCCGLTGRGFALLTLYRHSGEAGWLTRARRLGVQAAQDAAAMSQAGLFHGPVGPALLAAELAAPELAAMPLIDAW